METNNIDLNKLAQSVYEIYSQKPNKDFNGNEMILILKMLNNIEYFKDFKRKTIKIARCMYVRTFHAGEIVVRYGQEGKTFYVILKGEVDVMVPDFHARRASEMNFVYISTLKQGQAFGEMAMIRKASRAASIICKTDCLLAEIQYDDYIILFNQIELEKITRVTNFLKIFHIFNQLARPFLEKFYFLIERKNYKKGQYIYKEGDTLTNNGLYFIINGEYLVSKTIIPKVRGLQKIEKELNQLVSEENEYVQTLRGFQNINKKSNDNKLNTLFTLQTKKEFKLFIYKFQEYFGDVEYFANGEILSKRVYSISCVSPEGSLYFLPYKKLVTMLLPSLEETIIQIANEKYKMFNKIYNESSSTTKTLYSSHKNDNKKMSLITEFISSNKKNNFMRFLKKDEKPKADNSVKIKLDDFSTIREIQSKSSLEVHKTPLQTLKYNNRKLIFINEIKLPSLKDNLIPSLSHRSITKESEYTTRTLKTEQTNTSSFLNQTKTKNRVQFFVDKEK